MATGVLLNTKENNEGLDGKLIELLGVNRMCDEFD